MSRELLASQKNHSGIVLDPRTKLAVLTTIAVFILGGSYEGVMQYYIIVLAAIPLLLLLSAGKWKGAVLYLLTFWGKPLLGTVWTILSDRGCKFYRGCHCGAVPPVYAGNCHGVLRSHDHNRQRIRGRYGAASPAAADHNPMSVMFRFFPTVAEEWSAIGDAMRMRGVRFGGGKAGSILEYRMVPMMICSVKIGEELSAAALTRGLGGPVKRTNICKIWFRAQDIVLLLICLGAFAAQVYVVASKG